MSLTTGSGPLAPNPAGRFSAPVPAAVVYVEPFRRRVRGRSGGVVVLDSERVLLVHQPRRPPTYAFAAADVPAALGTPEPAAPGYVQVPWDAVEEWFEEEEQMFFHPRNPYHRVDSVRTTRRLRVELAGVVLVDTTDTVGVYETALEPRLYVARAHVRTDLLRPSAADTRTYCPYKGVASYWDAVIGDTVVADVAWSYEQPLPESTPIAGLLSFDETKTHLEADLPAPADLPWSP
ncbi:DUF427 domain-containing protein [Frankia sp. AgKG'84/4]|uniref:DUF427 domain-containing protein n=1 Tax=Frankia sp. AgKG'84/4 TaxID=573490 RepID=UPI00200D9946|nr:DUF427 domain-containing protein [Frankia sp. AgKG'84/4]MCL9792979.1 DUF427 domain-containing protein [Frankia sp. AgKG'84/4]